MSASLALLIVRRSRRFTPQCYNCCLRILLLISHADVLIAPTAIHIGTVKASLTPKVHVAVQDIHTVKVRVCIFGLYYIAAYPPSMRITGVDIDCMILFPTFAGTHSQGLGAYTGAHTAQIVSGVLIFPEAFGDQHSHASVTIELCCANR